MTKRQQSKRRGRPFPVAVADRRLRQLDRAVERGQVVELATELERRELLVDVAEFGELRRQLDRSAPFVPSWWRA